MGKGEENGRWKGAEASYAAKHIWMRNTFGKPQKCENCGTTEKRMYHWANISGTYLRERSDWLRLCVPCHKNHDVKALGGKVKARGRITQPTKICAECSVVFAKNPKESRTQWEVKAFCGKLCSAQSTARKNFGTKQSAETRALKTEKLKERWATNEEWRKHMSAVMSGNQYARKHSKVTR